MSRVYGIADKITKFALTLVAAPDTEVSRDFLQKMVDSMALSFFKYGPVAEGYPKNVSAIDSLVLRLVRYAGIERVNEALNVAASKCDHEGDGNKRWLVDVANFAMIETMHHSRSDAHWPEHDEKSPGRVSTGGVINEHANTASQEAVRKPDTAPSWMRREGD